MNTLLSGLLAFPLTPFTESLDVDLDAFGTQVEEHLAAGAGALFVACGTGEFSALAPAEVRALLRIAREVTRGRVPVFVGAGGGPELARAGVAMANGEGADGVLLLPPYLVTGPPAGLVDHMRYALRGSDVPVIVYHRAAGVFTPDTALALLDVPNVIGLKDGVGDVDLMTRIVASVRGSEHPRAARFQFLNGLPTAEVSARAYLAIGVPTYSSAVHCFAPEIAHAFHRALHQHDESTMDALLRGFYLPLVALRDETPGFAVALVKAAARLRGDKVGGVRPPLRDPTPDQTERLERIVAAGHEVVRGPAMRVLRAELTPVAFADPPLLNVMGVHEPWALRSVLQLRLRRRRRRPRRVLRGQCLPRTWRAGSAERIAGHDVFDLPGLRTLVADAVGARVYADQHGLTGTFSQDKTLATVYSLFEVASLDAQGHALGRPVVDLLGGRARDRVDFSRLPVLQVRRTRGRPRRRVGCRADAGRHCRAGEADDRPVRLPVHQAQGRGTSTGRRDPGRARAGHRVPRQSAADRPERRLDVHDRHPRRRASWTACWSTWRTRRRASPAWPRWPGRPRCRWPPTCAWSRFADLPDAVAQRAVGIVLSDHHYWGGLRLTQSLSVLCETFGIGLSMHSNSHLGISLAAMVHVAAATPYLTYACDTHWPWKTEDVIVPGVLEFRDGAVAVPDGPGLGIELDEDALARAHEDYLRCGLTARDDATYMRRFEPSFTSNTSRW